MKPYEMNEVYEISETYRGVIAAIEAEECTADAMAEALAIIEDEFESKIDAVACLNGEKPPRNALNGWNPVWQRRCCKMVKRSWKHPETSFLLDLP